MKQLGLILSFYFLLLAAVPCCAVDNCPDDLTEQSSGHENGDEECGNCSPFFSCEGCAAATIAYEPPQFEFSLIQEKPVFSAYFQTLLPGADPEFWQPPKWM